MSNKPEHKQDSDPVEDVVQHVHVVIPIVGAVMIFVMAAIAVTVA